MKTGAALMTVYFATGGAVTGAFFGTGYAIALGIIGALVGFMVWSMCAVSARSDELSGRK